MTLDLLHAALAPLSFVSLAPGSPADSGSRVAELGGSAGGIHWIWLCLALWFGVSLAMGGAWVVCDRLLSLRSARQNGRASRRPCSRPSPVLQFPR